MKALALIAALSLAACVHTPTTSQPSNGNGPGFNFGPPPSKPPKQCTNCGIDTNPPSVKTFDPNAVNNN